MWTQVISLFIMIKTKLGNTKTYVNVLTEKVRAGFEAAWGVHVPWRHTAYWLVKLYRGSLLSQYTEGRGYKTEVELRPARHVARGDAGDAQRPLAEFRASTCGFLGLEIDFLWEK